MTKEIKRIDSLQVVRALAFLGVFTSHSGITLFSPGGVWGVSVFFILSGFLMTYSYFYTDRLSECGVKCCINFGISKIRKLYPLHIVMLLVAVPLLLRNAIGLSGLKRFYIPSIEAIINALLIQAWFPNKDIYNSLNGVSWYLSVSLFLYILFPLIICIVRRYKSKWPAYGVIVITLIIQFLFGFISCLLEKSFSLDGFVHWFVYIFPLSRLEDFIIGVNLGYIFVNSKGDKESSLVKGTFLEITIVIFLIVQWIAYLVNSHNTISSAVLDPTMAPENWWTLSGYWTISSCALVYLFALNRGVISRFLTNKVLLFIGNCSANAFLIHKMVFSYLYIFESKVFFDIYRYPTTIICFIITIVCAYMWKRIKNSMIKQKR